MFIGPHIVTDGLVLNLDAANTKSYPGTGTTWSNLATTSNNGTLTNGPTFNSANGGSIVFDGTNDFVNTTLNVDANPNTIAVWFNASQTNGNRGIALSDNGGWDKGFEIADGLFAIHTGDNFASTGIPASSNIWYYGVIIYTASSMNFYVNGMNVWSAGAPGATTGSTLELGRANYLNGAGSRFFTGKIAQASVYNRALTATEVLQNYNATKSRFGL
jgi:hypothetical protein